MEPTSGTVGAVGLTALLVGVFGPVGTDVMLVVISAIAGSAVSLSGQKTLKWTDVLKFMGIGLSVALILSWALSGLLISYVPSLAGPYTPSIIAMGIGFLADRLPTIFNAAYDKISAKLFGVKE